MNLARVFHRQQEGVGAEAKREAAKGKAEMVSSHCAGCSLHCCLTLRQAPAAR